jgi:signal-transduction protein with cAMP-binding, CBS, and nucleotidyltransferase domain
MTILECCRAEVITASPEATAHEVARLMGEAGVGSVVITGPDDCPLGIVTDRDLAIRVLAENLDGKKVKAGDIMTGDLLVVEDGTGVYEAVRCARAEGVRRLPIVDAEGKLVGIITADDIVRLLAEELRCVTDIIREESP